MGIMKKWVTLTICFITISIHHFTGQSAIGQWADHLSYRNCFKTDVSENFIYGVSATGFFTIEKSTNSINKYSRVNLLSDYGISSFKLLEKNNFAIGYLNGNIDLFWGGKLFNIPDLKLKNIPGSKKINQFLLFNQMIYCSTDFGIVVVNPIKKEIAETYFIGPNGLALKIYDLTVSGAYFYAATEKGVYKAPTNSSSLNFYETWVKESPDAIQYLAIVNFNEKILATKQIGTNTFETGLLQNETWNNLRTVTNFKSINSSNDNFIITTQSSIYIYNSNLVLTYQKSSLNTNSTPPLTPSFNHAKIDSDQTLWIADNNHGLIKSSTSTDVPIYPNGPANNLAAYITSTPDALYSVAGGHDLSWNNLNRPSLLNIYFQNQWKSVNSSSDPLLKDSRDLLGITINPENFNQAFLYSWGDGVFELDNHVVVKKYDTSNSGIQNIDWAGKNYMRIGGLAFDKKGNIWLNNGEVSKGLVVKTPDNKWYQYTYKTLSGLHSMGQILIDNNDIKWMIIPRTSFSGLFVFDTNETVDNQNDDRYRGPVLPALENDSRNSGQLRLWDENGEELTNQLYCLAKDKNGYIWIGTNKGVVVNYRPQAVFNEVKPVFSRIKIPRNDGSGLADYLLENETILSIAIDGANRKWLGTELSGAFLLSEDGTATIEHFNTLNSPVPSNSIQSITVNPATGEVYFATDKGIVSFKGTATEGKKVMSSVYAYPNPVTKTYNGPIVIKGLVEKANVKITDVSGKIVYETISLGGQAIWKGRNLWGDKVASGVYLVFVASEDGQQSEVTKILIVN
jgi:ligand-binding sensor domain-containing protein